MEVTRNIQVKLDVSDEDYQVLDETFEQFRYAAQYVADYGWADDPTQIIDQKGKLNDATYYDVREQTDLNANHVQSARNLAANALSNAQDKIFDGEKASKPEFRGSVVVYVSRTITYNDDHCTLSTVDGRITADYITPENPSGTPFEEYWENDAWGRGEATLHKNDGEYYLHVAMEKDVDKDEETTKNGAVLGVDLNVDGYLAATSTGSFLGNADYVNHKRDEYERRRGRFQQVGTRSAHLTIQSIGDSFSAWSEDYLHRVSKAIVHEALEHDCSAIAFENLEQIRENISNASKFQQWSFRRIQEYTAYKAEEHGLGVSKVSPRYTSQRCSHSECGFTHEENRDGDEFECLKCGKELHADYNAARNVAWNLVQNWLKSGSGRAECQVALKSGMLNANGEFSSTQSGQSGSPLTSPPL